MGAWGLYFCPICLDEFSKLSSLFQHIESPACEQGLDEGVIGTLQRYLEAHVDTGTRYCTLGMFCKATL